MVFVRFDRLMRMRAVVVVTRRARYVDVRTPSATHGLCALSTRRWLEGAVPTFPVYPYHPNATRMAHAAEIIAGRLHEFGQGEYFVRCRRT
jgi:hypothetical protein